MCDEKDAKRYEKLAILQEEEKDFINARHNYLEAASIYVLESEVKKDEKYLQKANECYKKSREILGESIKRPLSKRELAKKTLFELEEFNGMNKMCGEKSIMTLIELAKKQEKKDPVEASRNYLKAADALLKESYHDPSREEEYIAIANRIYIRAKELKKIQIEGNNDNTLADQFKQANIINKKDNKLSFSDIGGLEELKEEIKFKIIEPFKNPDIYKYYGKSVGGGILMYGPPGCGKSLIAKATANEANATFIHVKSSDLKSKFVGETEKNIAELFVKAREQQPTIIFFDEFEALGGDRAEGLSHERSAVAQLLTEMDGMDSKDQQILLLAATNEPWAIDPALRREGRFGKTLFIPEPDKAARKKIIEITMESRPTEKFELDKIIEMTKGFSGADIKAVCETATDIPLKESIKTGKRRKVNLDDFLEGVNKTQSVLKQWYKKARQKVSEKRLEESFKDLIEASNNSIKEKEIDAKNMQYI